jgi:hypothetical protein
MRPAVQLNINVVMQVDNLRDFKVALEYLRGSEVLVGIPDTKAERRDEDAEEINNAALGYIHNYGAPEINIPARPFIEPGLEDAAKPINSHLLAAGQQVMNGKKDRAEAELHAVGLVAQNAVRNRINEGPFKPLAPSTLKARRKRGRTGERPLIDTGQLRNAISYVVRKRTGKKLR